MSIVKPCPENSHTVGFDCYSNYNGCRGHWGGWLNTLWIVDGCDAPSHIVLGMGDRLGCNGDEDQDASLCYKKCPSGYRGAGPVCHPNDGAGIKTTLGQRQYCSDPNKKLKDGGCWSVCPSGSTLLRL